MRAFSFRRVLPTIVVVLCVLFNCCSVIKTPALGWTLIREFFDSLVVTYRSGTVVSYACSHERQQVIAVENTPVFHEHPGIETSPQLALFDLSMFEGRYVTKRPPNRKHPSPDASQLIIQGLES